MPPFHYHGQPVSSADAITMLQNRKAHRQYGLNARRRADEKISGIHRQLWATITPLLKRKGA